MKKILIISFSNLKTDPRVRRQIFALNESYNITALGYVDCAIDKVKFYKIKKPIWNWKDKLQQRILLLLKRYESTYNLLPQVVQTKELLNKQEFDIIIANDIESLPIVCKLFSNSKIYFDAHEYSPRQFEDNFWWRFYFANFKFYLCKKYIPMSTKMSTVCTGLAQEYQNEFGKKCLIVTSASSYTEQLPSVTDEKKIRLIHHGYASKNRSIHLMIEMMDYVDERFTLDLMLIPNQKEYFKKLEAMVHTRENVRIIKPVPFEQITPFINKYDIGLYILPPTGFNTKYMLPNKFFEYIQARLAIAISPSIEMVQLTKKYDLGVISKDFSPKSMSNELNNLTQKDIIKYKRNSHNAAKVLNAEANYKKIKTIIEN